MLAFFAILQYLAILVKTIRAVITITVKSVKVAGR